MRNGFVPINTLPPEILVHVCTFAPNLVSDFAHLCAQVCRTWRNTLLASPSLWNEIRTEDPLHVDVHLARSGKVPLEVYFCEGSPVDGFCQKIVPHMGRVRLLSLSISAGDHRRILDSLRDGPEMTLLRDFHFKKASDKIRLSALGMKKVSSLAANITNLSLYNVNTHLSSLTFPRLLYFALTTGDGFKGPCISDMIGFLRGHPMLKDLDLNRTNYSDADSTGTHIEPVALRYLKSTILGGTSSSNSPDSLPYIKVDLLPYLLLPPTGRCEIRISPKNVRFPYNTNHLLTLIRAWEIISSPGGGFGGGSGFTQANLSIEESPSTLTGQVELRVPGWGGLCVSPGDMAGDSRSWLTPDWETTTTDGDPGGGEAGDDEFQAQLSRLGCYLDPLRWSPSPLATLRVLTLCGFGYTTNKGKYLQYLRECFAGLNRVRKFRVDKTNPGMVVQLLQPFEGGSMVLLPLLRLLTFSNCTPAELHRSRFLEVMKQRAALGNILKAARVDGVKVDLSELSDIQERT